MTTQNPAAIENKNFRIGKSAEWFRFEITGADEMTIESYWFDDIRRTERVSIRGARKIWKMLIENGFKDETGKTESERIAAENAKPEFGNKLDGTPNEPTASDIARNAKVAERDAAIAADLAARGLKTCPKCRGTKTLNGLSRFKCHRCNGTGSVPAGAFERK